MKWLSDSTLDHLREVAGAPDFSATKYRITRAVGRGGMATVYLAQDAELNRDVAIKVLDAPDPAGELSERIKREAMIVARLEHPGIVPIHDVGILPDDRVFYVMKYVRGERLDAFAQKTLPEKLRVFQRICEPVAFAHAQGVIHRDLKPENVMVGSFGEVLVMDWGVAKQQHRNDEPANSPPKEIPEPAGFLTGHGRILGTPAYMAPEQSAGEIDQVDARSDVYSLGAILYFLLTGEPPARNSAQIESPRKKNPKIGRPLEAVCMRAMEHSQANRYATAMDLARDVGHYLDDLPVSAYQENIYEKAVRWTSRNHFFVLLLLAYILMRVLVILLTGR